MSIKRILVPLPGSADHSSEMAAALATAKLLGAHVEALCIHEPLPAASGIGGGEGAYAAARLAAARPLTTLADEREREIEELREGFTRICLVHGVPLLKPDEVPASLPAATFRVVEGQYATVAVERAAAFDLMVATSAAIVAQLKDIAERSLLRTQRPVLLAPLRAETALDGRVVIAWDESLQCWHAVSAAIPFLEKAKSVEIVSVDRDPDVRRASLAEVQAYLACHGIQSATRVVAPDSMSIGARLLAEAAELEAGLLVMGAYAHSRLREMLLGGATRHVLQNATATPVLMAH